MSRQTGKSRPSLLPAAVIIAILGGLSIGAYLYMRHSDQLANEQNTPASELQQVVAKVGRLAVLPTDEEPALFTVVDKDKQQQAFFSAAQNGDKVLIYTGIRKAILYRPSIDKIVEMAPLVTGTSTTQ